MAEEFAAAFAKMDAEGSPINYVALQKGTVTAPMSKTMAAATTSTPGESPTRSKASGIGFSDSTRDSTAVIRGTAAASSERPLRCSNFRAFWRGNFPALAGASGEPRTDHDDDGFPNVVEFLCGTDPLLDSNSSATDPAGARFGLWREMLRITNCPEDVLSEY